MNISYKFDKNSLIGILESNNISYKKIKERELSDYPFFEVYFDTRDDLIFGLNLLGKKQYSNTICKIDESRINLKYLMIYVIPFKSFT